MIAKRSIHGFGNYNSRSPFNPKDKQGYYPIILHIEALNMV